MENTNCPHCGHHRHESLECLKCGIIFEKYIKLQARKSAKKDIQEETASNEMFRNEAPPRLSFLRRMLIRILFGKKDLNQPEDIFKKRNSNYLLKQLKKNSMNYAGKIYDSALDIIMYLITTLLVYGLIFTLLRMTWTGYISTATGQHFIRISPDQAALISGMLGKGFRFILEITMYVLPICLLTAVVFQFSHISRIVYYKGNLLRNFMLCGLPLIGANGFYLTTVHYLEFQTACFIVALPVLCLYDVSFIIASKLIPEIGDILSALKKGAGFIRTESFPRMKTKVKEITDRINAA